MESLYCVKEGVRGWAEMNSDSLADVGLSIKARRWVTTPPLQWPVVLVLVHRSGICEYKKENSMTEYFYVIQTSNYVRERENKREVK